jgi:hypothetical protein
LPNSDVKFKQRAHEPGKVIHITFCLNIPPMSKKLLTSHSSAFIFQAEFTATCSAGAEKHDATCMVSLGV